MPSPAKLTTDHAEIYRWVEDRGGQPAIAKGLRAGDSDGALRIDFPGGAGEDQLEHVAWHDWFQQFEQNNLALLYQDQTADGEDSTFCKLLRRDGSS